MTELEKRLITVTPPPSQMEGIPLSERTVSLISKMFSRSDGPVISDLLFRAVSGNIPLCGDSTPEEMERIRFAILKITYESPLKLALGILMAQTDWRDLLMTAGFGEDVTRHLAWCDEMMNPDGQS